MDYEITRDIETLGGHTERVQHLSAVLKADTIAYTRKVTEFKKCSLFGVTGRIFRLDYPCFPHGTYSTG